MKMNRLLTGIIGLLMTIGGGYLVILWWEGNTWQLFLSGALAAGGLGVLWSAIKGGKLKSHVQKERSGKL